MLVANMLHIASERRPTAAQLVKHPWLQSRTPALYQAQCQLQPIPQNASYINQNIPTSDVNQSVHLKETVAATFRAIATSPQIANLGPVDMSELARRRFRDKALSRVQQGS